MEPVLDFWKSLPFLRTLSSTCHNILEDITMHKDKKTPLFNRNCMKKIRSFFFFWLISDTSLKEAYSVHQFYVSAIIDKCSRHEIQTGSDTLIRSWWLVIDNRCEIISFSRYLYTNYQSYEKLLQPNVLKIQY